MSQTSRKPIGHHRVARTVDEGLGPVRNATVKLESAVGLRDAVPVFEAEVSTAESSEHGDLGTRRVLDSRRRLQRCHADTRASTHAAALGTHTPLRPSS